MPIEAGHATVEFFILRLPTLSRRQAVLGGLGAVLSLRAPRSSGAEPALLVREVANGIYIRRGIDEDASLANDDAIANVGFIVGNESVAVFDPGGCLRDGERLRAAVRRTTPLPIRYVLMSHVHPDHIFGAGAFREDRPEFIGHSRLPAAMAQRGEYYRERLDAILGKGRAGPVVMPTRVVAEREQIDLGGRVLELHAHGIAHSDCDMTVSDPQTGTLLAGDLLFVKRVPALEGRLSGWLATLALLKALPLRRAVPGHGPTSVNWPAGSGDLERYLNVLRGETRRAVRDGLDINAAVSTVGRSERGRWTLFENYHGHNVTQAFKEVEWE